ncbi:hypothetical protein HPB52_002290 [Rhipicephalus sanguineus]|uniref:Uncharacterized protein n=1 Tax=Rhipicephalus sanguineus TaxID=34632 RepID=A0A9D4PU21_RHISA|nr:hypothetical protein HPB52_002290 [Rhipicephalus sanguineus]
MFQRHRALDDDRNTVSSGQLSEQPGWSYYNPSFERSQGFDLPVPFDEPDLPFSYCQNADPYAIEADWLAAQRSISAVREGTRRTMTKQFQASESERSCQDETVFSSAVTPSARGPAVPRIPGYADPSTSTTMTGTTAASSVGSSGSDNTGFSAHGITCNRACSDWDPRCRIDALRRLHSPPTKQQEDQVSRWNCVPVVMISLVVAFLVLLSLLAMTRTNRMIASVVTADRVNTYHNRQKAVSSVPGATVKALAHSKSSTMANSTKWHGSETTNVVSVSSDPREDASYTPDAEPEVRKPVPSSSKSTRHSRTANRAAVPRTPSGDRGNTEARENSEDHFAFPFQYPKRPMCDDVFYTLCQPSPQREFHYRRSMNACVETAADVVHSCNRGDNRFTSLVHCRQRCMGVGRRPASECFGKPLFTNCARQDVLSSWWFFEGTKCVPWNFPSGGCPANHSVVFRTAQECRKQCMVGRLGGSPCRPPRTIACELQHLKYPFFADPSPRDGRLRCLRSSLDVLRDRRCLTGANRFRTLEACEVTCQKTQRA